MVSYSTHSCKPQSAQLLRCLRAHNMLLTVPQIQNVDFGTRFIYYQASYENICLVPCEIRTLSILRLAQVKPYVLIWCISDQDLSWVIVAHHHWNTSWGCWYLSWKGLSFSGNLHNSTQGIGPQHENTMSLILLIGSGLFLMTQWYCVKQQENLMDYNFIAT